MKYLLFSLIAASIALAGSPAIAHVVQATSSVALSDVDVNDKPQLKQVIESAVNQVLKDTIAFKPSLVALTDAQVIGERLYFRVLIADEEGERTLDALTGAGGDASPGPDGGRPVKGKLTL